MTRDEILKMEAGRELDALIGEKVMGWHLIPEDYTDEEDGIKHWAQMWLDADNKLMHNKWSPSTDISAAWEVVEKMNEKLSVRVVSYCKSDCLANIWNVSNLDKEYHARADTIPLAICRAALLTTLET